MVFPASPPATHPPINQPADSPQHDETPSPRLPEGLRLALAAGLAAALVLVVLVMLARGGGDAEIETADGALASTSDGAGSPLLESPGAQPDATPGSSADSDGADPDSTDPEIAGGPAGGCPEGTIGEICDAVAFIEAFKGDRPFKTFPTVNFIDGDAFDAFVLEDFDEAVPDLRNTGDVLRTLGLIEPDIDLAEALRTSLELGVVGAYNTETEELNINGTEVNLYTQSVMVHELTHAWDDQYFELARPEYDDAEDEIGSGFLNVVEGSASLAEAAWRDTLTNDQRSELETLELSAISPEEMDLLFAVPLFVLQLQISPYTDGAAFVRSIYDEQGMDGVDALFDDPPTTTEQVLDVDAYRNREAAIAVVTPTPDGAVIDEGVLGRLTFDLWFGPDVGAGWGGDAYVAWHKGTATCTAFTVTGDDRADTTDYLGALESWAREAPPGATRSVTLVDPEADLPHVEAVACI